MTDVRRAAARRAVSVKRRLERRRPASGALTCQVCGAERPPFEELRSAKKPDRVRELAVCPSCGFVQIKELMTDRYRGKTDMEQLPGGTERIGSEKEPGREFRMSRMALDILDRDHVEVMIYGIGRSLDNHHVATLPRVDNVAIGDIMKLRDDGEFHDANQPARKKFPIVIASEVVEHFRDPHADFAKLFQFVARDGLLVCGTNIHNGADLARDPYPFWVDHTSYYSPEALALIAERHGFHLDFRTPLRAGEKGRKRYVLFTRSEQVRRRIPLYFGRRTFAPSE